MYTFNEYNSIFVHVSSNMIRLGSNDQMKMTESRNYFDPFEGGSATPIWGRGCHAPVLGYKGIRDLEKNKIIHEFKYFYI
jgi:hypothetical protein